MMLKVRPSPQARPTENKSLLSAAKVRNGCGIQHLDQEQPKTVEGSEGANYPFWSPDSKVIGFGSSFDSRSALMRVSAEGGVRTRICAIPVGFLCGAARSQD